MATMPQIDFFMGRPVKSVAKTRGKDEWYIEFEGGGRIYIPNPEDDEGNGSYPMPDPEVLVDKKLSKQVLARDGHILYFGTDQDPTATMVNLPATGFEISDPSYSKGERVDPNTPPELVGALEPSAPGERVVEGPEESQEAVSGDETVEGHQVLDSDADDE